MASRVRNKEWEINSSFQNLLAHFIFQHLALALRFCNTTNSLVYYECIDGVVILSLQCVTED